MAPIRTASDHSSVAGQPSAGPTSQRTAPNKCALTLLHSLQTGDPVADIILVGDLSKSDRNTWEQDGFFWPGKIPQVDVYEFSYPTVDVVPPNDTRSDAITALRKNISPGVLSYRSKQLKNAVSNPNWSGVRRRAPYVILVGYGYGGLLCEQVITLTGQRSPASGVIKGLVLFGTPHFSNGLQQWAKIVVQTTAKSQTPTAKMGWKQVAMRVGKSLNLAPAPDLSVMPAQAKEFGFISSVQRSFFGQTRRRWGDRIGSCFPESSPSTSQHGLTITPEWSIVPFSFLVDVGKPYREMTAFKRDEEKAYQVILDLIERWIEEIDRESKVLSILRHSSSGKGQGMEAQGTANFPDKTQTIPLDGWRSQSMESLSLRCC
ncbi:hypothetical protein F4859DRAFT_49488 [Xylaria cf. heliscus]|nr:hypothetical protein F4859DRAFT_49488 [Xylaria cf. heliscus]